MRIEILGAKFQVLGLRCAPHYCSGPSSTTPGITTLRGYGANRHSGREISNSGPEMCTPLFLRPKPKPAGHEKPIRVAPIRVVTKYPKFALRGRGHRLPTLIFSRILPQNVFGVLQCLTKTSSGPCLGCEHNFHVANAVDSSRYRQPLTAAVADNR